MEWHVAAQLLIDRLLDITIGLELPGNQILFTRLRNEDFCARVREVLVRPAELQRFFPEWLEELAILGTFLQSMRLSKFM